MSTKKKNEVPVVRLARKQKAQTKKVDTSGEYNIWYHKHSGPRNINARELSETRCNIDRDAGMTRGDQMGTKTFCVHFARGCCIKGPECTFLHRVPTPLDDLRLTVAEDVFGRERHATDKDDMGGVGSFSRDNRTIYIGGLHIAYQGGQKMEERIRKHFGEFGEIEELRIIPSKSCGFVRYVLRACAEFAKEAMTNQTLGDEAVLNVRWATEDPNPKSKERDERSKIETLAQAQVAHGHLKQEMVGELPLANAQMVAKAKEHADRIKNSGSPETKRRRLEVETEWADSQAALQAGSYPDTSAQYQQAAATTAPPTYEEQWNQWAYQYYAYYGVWPTYSDWEYSTAMSYYGGPGAAVEGEAGPEQGPALPEACEGPQLPEPAAETAEQPEAAEDAKESPQVSSPIQEEPATSTPQPEEVQKEVVTEENESDGEPSGPAVEERKAGPVEEVEDEEEEEDEELPPGMEPAKHKRQRE